MRRSHLLLARFWSAHQRNGRGVRQATTTDMIQKLFSKLNALACCWTVW